MSEFDHLMSNMRFPRGLRISPTEWGAENLWIPSESLSVTILRNIPPPARSRLAEVLARAALGLPFSRPEGRASGSNGS